MENLTTTIEWHLAEKELPEKSGYYLVVPSSGMIYSIHFSAKHNQFNVYDWMGEKELEKYESLYPTVYWAEMPEYFSWDRLAKYREE